MGGADYYLAESFAIYVKCDDGVYKQVYSYVLDERQCYLMDDSDDDDSDDYDYINNYYKKIDRKIHKYNNEFVLYENGEWVHPLFKAEYEVYCFEYPGCTQGTNYKFTKKHSGFTFKSCL